MIIRDISNRNHERNMDINENQHEPLVERLEVSMDDLDDSLDNLQNSIEYQEDVLDRMKDSLEEMKWVVVSMFIIMMVMFLWILTKMNRVEELTSKMDYLEFIMNQSIATRDVHTLVKLWIMWKVLCASYDTLLSWYHTLSTWYHTLSTWYAERKGKQVSWREEPHNE